MKNDEFLAIVDYTFIKVQELSELKGGEYSGDTDRLLNFKRNGEHLQVQPELVWAVYAAKHWDAIMQYVNDLVHGRTRQRSESLEGRADDLILYLLLFKAFLKERGKDDLPSRPVYPQ